MVIPAGMVPLEITAWLNKKPHDRAVLMAYRMDGLVAHAGVVLVDSETKERHICESRTSFNAAFELAAQFVRENP